MAVNPFSVMNLAKMQLRDPRKIGYEDSIDIIREELYKTRKSFIKIGWYLKHIEEGNMHIENGYQTIYELALDQFNISESTASRFIRLCENFSVDNNSPELDEKYEDFSVSQLFEMLPMETEQRQLIQPGMTVKEIRDVKKSLKEENATSHEESIPENEDMIPGQINIQEFPEYLPQNGNEKSHATSHESKASCPPGMASCPRQQWGTSEAEQQEGRQECDRCWDRYKKLQDGLNTDTSEHAVVEITEEVMKNDEDSSDYMIIDESIRKFEDEENSVTEGVDIQIEEGECQAYNIPVLKNVEERKAWLADYQAWGLWYRDENIDVNYYKFDFEDGSRIIACEYPLRESEFSEKPRDEIFYHLLEKNKSKYGNKSTYDDKFRQHTTSETYIVEFLKKFK